MFIDYRLELIIHSLLLGVLIWFAGSSLWEDVIVGYCGLISIAGMAYAHFKYKGDPEYNFITSTYFFAVAGVFVAVPIGGLFVACALEGILN